MPDHIVPSWTMTTIKEDDPDDVSTIDWKELVHHVPLKGRTTDPEALNFDEAVSLFRSGLRQARDGQIDAGLPLIAAACLLDSRAVKFLSFLPDDDREEAQYCFLDKDLLQDLIDYEGGSTVASEVLMMYSAIRRGDVRTQAGQTRIARALSVSDRLLKTIQSDPALEDPADGVLGGYLKRTTVHGMRSSLYALLGNHKKAMQELTCALVIDPFLASARCSRACLYASLEGWDSEVAMQEFRRTVTDSHPDSSDLPVAYAWLAKIILLEHVDPTQETRDLAKVYWHKCRQAAARYAELYGDTSRSEIEQEMLDVFGEESHMGLGMHSFQNAEGSVHDEDHSCMVCGCSGNANSWMLPCSYCKQAFYVSEHSQEQEEESRLDVSNDWRAYAQSDASPTTNDVTARSRIPKGNNVSRIAPRTQTSGHVGGLARNRGSMPGRLAPYDEDVEDRITRSRQFAFEEGDEDCPYLETKRNKRQDEHIFKPCTISEDRNSYDMLEDALEPLDTLSRTNDLGDPLEYLFQNQHPAGSRSNPQRVGNWHQDGGLRHHVSSGLATRQAVPLTPQREPHLDSSKISHPHIQVLRDHEGQELANQCIRSYLLRRWEEHGPQFSRWWYQLSTLQRQDMLNVITQNTIPIVAVPLGQVSSLLRSGGPRYGARVLTDFSLQTILGPCRCKEKECVEQHGYRDQLLHDFHYYVMFWGVAEAAEYKFCVEMVQDGVFPDRSNPSSSRHTANRYKFMEPPRDHDPLQVHRAWVMKKDAPQRAIDAVWVMVDSGTLKEYVPFSYLLLRDSYRLAIFALIMELFDELEFGLEPEMPLAKLQGCEHCRHACLDSTAIQCPTCMAKWWCGADCRHSSAHGYCCPTGTPTKLRVQFS